MFVTVEKRGRDGDKDANKVAQKVLMCITEGKKKIIIRQIKIKCM